jgi:hypothetical protein
MRGVVLWAVAVVTMCALAQCPQSKQAKTKLFTQALSGRNAQSSDDKGRSAEYR